VPSPEPEEDAAPDPADPASWRVLLSHYPARALVRLVQTDKKRAARVFAGFRPAPDVVRHPVVLNRLADEAVKNPAFARLVIEGVEAALTAPNAVAEYAPVEDAMDAPAALAAPAAPSDDERRNRKIKEQRAALRDRDARIAALEAAIAQAERECGAAQAEARAARDSEKDARAEADRIRHEREREAARRAVPIVVEEPAPPPPKPPRPQLREAEGAAAPAPVAAAGALLLEALRRLLSRSKHEVVATVCREALARPGGPPEGASAATKSGPASLHALFAQALYAAAPSGDGKNEAAGAEQDRFACSAYLDASNAPEAALCFARSLAHDPKGGDKALLARLLALARRFGQEEAVRATFVRLRASNRAAFGRLSDLLSGLGASGAAFLPSSAAPAPPHAVGPDEVIALPTGGVTARDIAFAVDVGDVGYVVRARGGLARLRAAAGSDAALADALIASVAALGPGTAVPLTEPTQPVVVDASNVARHAPDPFALHAAPRVAYLTQMRDFLLNRRFFPVHLIADANLRFLVDDRAAYLVLVERGVVRETPGGVVADAVLINTAREHDAPLVTNDHLSDWDEARALQRLGFLILPDRITLTPF